MTFKKLVALTTLFLTGTAADQLLRGEGSGSKNGTADDEVMLTSSVFSLSEANKHLWLSAAGCFFTYYYNLFGL